MTAFQTKEVCDKISQAGIEQSNIVAALDLFPKKKILLVGDLIIDIYTECTAIGKTAKTPTLSVKRGSSKQYWGGSSLICNNLLAMNGEVTFVAVTGDDWGYDYFSQRKQPGFQGKFFKDSSRPTTIKERLWVDGYKLLQVDTVENHDISPQLQEEIFGFIAAEIERHDVLLVADNRHGMMPSAQIQRLKALCKKVGKPMVVDTQVSSRWGNLEEYADASIICVNETEARFFLRDERAPKEELLARLVEMLRPERLLVKLKHKGVIGWDRTQGIFSFPAVPVAPVDPIGAGDAFLSAATLSFHPDVNLMTSMFLASCSGAIAVTKMGTDPSTFDEIRDMALGIIDSCA
ncbi:MAG: hypothetical protein COV45_05225 [Deltaproteobacteria bacterium CG11_big_fil_rev_8_21_14_0_20_47_16]|nr:MAG: hypothetical protein COV45_05225 [Deltaproteobacteria bacterium CG11_big_fil_rev_8_21_14_0_20_47_16]